MQHYAIIVAAGKGERMNNELPKQFMPIHGKPMLYYSIKAFMDAIVGIKIIVVLPQNTKQNTDNILALFPNNTAIQFVEGGNNRFVSVKNGLQVIPTNTDGLVFVHDAARPMASTALIQALEKDALQFGNAIPCIELTDSIRYIDGNKNEAVDRTKYKIIQTPQVANITTLQKVFLQSYTPTFTDEASVLEAHGETIFLSTGDTKNIKITTPEQLIIATHYLQ